MPLLKPRLYTSDDYWNLPENTRAELIDGQLYNMAPPSRIHQRISGQLYITIGTYIEEHRGNCQIYAAPFAVNLDCEDKNWVEPDLSVICDPDKLTDRGCSSAPDLIIEIVSPSSRRMDYVQKPVLYLNSGVREYWIVDPVKKCTTVHLYDQDPAEFAPVIFPFESDIRVGIYSDLCINISKLL